MPQQSKEARKRIRSKRSERSVRETVRKKRREGGSERGGGGGEVGRGNRQTDRQRRRHGMR